jgi:hypothetical protein
MKNGWTKNAFKYVNNEKCSKMCKCFSHLLLITLMDYLCSHRKPNFETKYFMFDWSMYMLTVLNRAWKRETLQITIFEYVCWTCRLVELKTRFQTWITRNDINGVILFHLSLIITHMAYLCSQWTPDAQIKYF